MILSDILSNIFDLNATQCCLITASIFTIPFKKREHFPLRLLLGLVIGLFCAPLITSYQHLTICTLTSSAKGSLTLSLCALMLLQATVNILLYVLMLTVFFFVCLRLSLLTAAYCASCAYLVQDFAYTLFVWIYPDAAHRNPHPIQPDMLWLELLLMFLCNLFFYFFLTKKIFSYTVPDSERILALGYLFLMLCCGRTMGTLSNAIRSPDTLNLFRFLLLYDMLLSVSILLAQGLLFQRGKYRREAELETQLRQQQYQQFQRFKQASDHIKHQCHDMKHLIAALRANSNQEQSQALLSELETSVSDYDSSMNTGNQTLDAILGNTWRNCRKDQIQWTCMADGSGLQFIPDFDLYVLFGNVLDNALEHLRQIEDPQKRVLSVNIRRHQQLCFITIQNYCANTPDFEHGLPITSKSDKSLHGYGSKSIQSIVEKYQGSLSIQVEHHFYILSIMFPIPSPAGQ